METYSRDKSTWIICRWYCPGGVFNGATIPPTDRRTLAILDRKLNGYKNPNWRSQVANLQNATTPASGFYLTLNYSEGWHWVIRKDSSNNLVRFDTYGSYAGEKACTIRSGGGPQLWPTTTNNSVAYNRAVIAFRKKVRALQVAFSSPTFLGELRETIHMIRHPAQGLSNLARSYLQRVKDAKKKRPRDWQKNLSSLWLEQAFGWQPLISDINQAHKAYESKIRTEVQFVSGFGKSESLRSLSFNGNQSEVSGMVHFVTSRRQTESQLVKLRGCVKHQVQAPSKEVLTRFGFTPSEFVPTAWELMPWSFLIDYFTNIGDIITANVTSLADLAWVDQSVIVEKSEEDSSIPFNLSQYKSLSSSYMACDGVATIAKLVSREWSRSPNVGIPFGSIEFSLPGLPAQWANMTALFAQANGIHPQRRR